MWTFAPVGGRMAASTTSGMPRGCTDVDNVSHAYVVSPSRGWHVGTTLGSVFNARWDRVWGVMDDVNVCSTPDRA